ncbi:MAG: acyl-CoA synthetase [Tetrasphaera sp.]
MSAQHAAGGPSGTPLERAAAVPERFNMARYCLAPGELRPADATALVVVHDLATAAADAESWTFAALDDAVRAVAAGLLAAGLAPGDRVLIRLPNTSSYPLIFFGALAAGVVAIPTSSQLTAEEFAFLVADAAPQLVVCDPSLGVPLPAGLPVVGPAEIDDWCGQPDRAPYADTAPDDPAYLVYTSGTSDRPKGVVHAHRAAWGRRPMYAAWLGLQPGDVVLHTGAFNWTYTLGVGLTDPWANGASAVIYNGPKDLGVWPALIERYRATHFAAVPGLYPQLLRHGGLTGADLSSLRHGLVAGEALSPALWRQWREATGTELFEALGMSECSTFISSGPSIPTRPGSPGKPQPGRRVAVLPHQGLGTEPLPAGEVGLLAVHRSDPGLMLGYWQRPQEEAAAYRGEWFVTSDLVHFDADGYVHYHGRADDVMTAMGYRVSPLEVEECLARHPGVGEAAVAEVEVREGLRIITAFVVPRDPDDRDTVDASVLLAYAADHLAGYKRPREVVFVDALPRTANGKILRRELAGRHTRLSGPASG